MNKNKTWLAALAALLLSSCKNTPSPVASISDSTQFGTESSTVISSSIDPAFVISDELKYMVKSENNRVIISAYTLSNLGTHTISYCLDQSKGMDENNVYKIVYSIEHNKTSFYAYNGAEFIVTDKNAIEVSFDYNDEADMFVTDFYIACEDKKEERSGKFSFYPEYYDGHAISNYTRVWEYMRNNYPQTWFMFNTQDELYYDETFETYENEHWTRPSFKAKEGSHLAYSCSENTIEGARVSAMCAERMGATAFDLHIEGFKSKGLLTAENIERITKAVNIPVLAIFYDGSTSQQARLNGLKVAVEGGAAAVDLQGFMYWTGSTLETQNEANIQYWENQGFDMSFVSAHPVETILDIDGINQQKAYIQEIHDMGAEVLLSSHNKAVYTKQQAIAYAKFIEDRGVDVIKLVGYGNNSDDLNACIEANKAMEEEISCRFSFHLQSNEFMRITRLVCPLYYGAFLAFCYYNMTHLNMMVELSRGDIPSKDASLEDVIAFMQAHTTHSELNDVIASYRQCPEPVNYIIHAYGASSEMSYKWDCGEGYAHIALREEDSSNSFNIRAYAYRQNHKGSSFSYSCSISGLFYPYVSSTRNPKVGIMLGDENSMLAFVYQTDTKTVDLMHNESIFAYDSPKSDRLYSTNSMTSPTYTTEVHNLGKIHMGMYVDENALKLYFSEGEEALSLLATFNMSDVESMIGGEGNVGSVLELYLGSASANKINYLHFDDIVFTKDRNIFEA